MGQEEGLRFLDAQCSGTGTPDFVAFASRDKRFREDPRESWPEGVRLWSGSGF